MSKKKFPKAIYVKREGNGDDEFLSPHETIEKTAEIGGVVEVAIYSLDTVVKVKTKTLVE